ncbi:MAG: rod shape-determining protein MreC [Ferrovum sp.]|nr:rod shape-determining protein MreC [Ferrovum sp.]NDU87868.1 rod shape-determining protein MreC [Ferrovum sp.]
MSPLETRPLDLFSRSASPWFRGMVYALLALACIATDAHFHRLEMLRQALEVMTVPIQEAAEIPSLTKQVMERHFDSLSRLQEENTTLRRQLLLQTGQAQQATLLLRDLNQMRGLLQLQSSPLFPARVSAIISSARNPFVQKLLLEGGESQQIHLGSPVLTEQGLLGQITRVYPLYSEVTLVSNRNLTIPVEIERTALRTLAVGSGHQGEMTLPYVPSGSDVRPGDFLLTSGIDGLYPRGLTVATVTQVNRSKSSAFADITARLNAGVDSAPFVLVMTPSPAAPLMEESPAETGSSHPVPTHKKP